ncbi:hypothetical protein B0H63DRAFT_464189 [Podospora didyma]|uniref:Uncharacterized protein n=1 Tax=Podospora didyma TaxID=330526 RepID=A0AAE0NXU6_9PEZI|nr:hypothetical protein B0H63DRAFT_464189 [Podospora didyma]
MDLAGVSLRLRLLWWGPWWSERLPTFWSKFWRKTPRKSARRRFEMLEWMHSMEWVFRELKGKKRFTAEWVWRRALMPLLIWVLVRAFGGIAAWC